MRNGAVIGVSREFFLAYVKLTCEIGESFGATNVTMAENKPTCASESFYQADAAKIGGFFVLIV